MCLRPLCQRRFLLDVDHWPNWVLREGSLRHQCTSTQWCQCQKFRELACCHHPWNVWYAVAPATASRVGSQLGRRLGALTNDTPPLRSPRFLISAISTPKSRFWMLGAAFLTSKASPSMRYPDFGGYCENQKSLGDLSKFQAL